MATTLDPHRVSGNGSGATSPVGIVPAKRRQRSIPLAITAVAVMAVCVIAFVGTQLAATDRQPVLAIARPVTAGNQVSADDLTVAQLAPDPALKSIALSQKASVVGKTAAVDLAPGSLLTDASLGPAAVVGDGEALVGVDVPSAAAPIDAIHSGDRVQIVGVDKGADGKAQGLGQALTEGRVVRVSATRGSTGSAMTSSVSVIVPADKAASVAAASVAQRVALVVIR